MFSSAFKSISSSSNISSNYTVSPTHTSTAGAWKIFDCKKKSTGKAYSVFVFDKKSLDASGGAQSLGRASASALKRATDEVVERLRKEASSLARLRHPSILELVEPVEDTRGGGLQFVTEAVTASLSSLLQDKDDQERAGGVGGRASRFVTEDSDGVRRRRELEIDELEIQKGLLQVSKALEFLHDNAGLVHANLTPDAVLINAKSDWKLSGLAFCSPPEGSTKPTSFQPVSLSEILSPDPRLSRFVQLSLDYTSPDFVLDNNLTASADMFSLGLLCIALYNSPHRSPLESHGSVSTYKRLFASSSTIPSSSNSFMSSRPLPRDLSAHVLPRLITRRPAQRMTASEFQNSEYFDNILVSTIRFLDAFPAKTPNEKAQFMRGLNKVLPSFPKSVMEKKILPALLDELKDRDLIALILQNVFKIIELLPSAKRVFSDKVRMSLKDIFVTAPAAPSKQQPQQEQQRDPAKDAGLMVVLENMSLISNNCGGKEFTDDILPIIMAAIESATPAVVDAALRGLPAVLPVLDFSTIKNELFPVIAAVFSKTSSLAIKVRGCQAFVVLCGGTNSSSEHADGLGDFGAADARRRGSSSSMLDKYTMQEKIIPLIKAIKTKEPAVMMAAHSVLRVVGEAADADFVAMEILPILWHMSLGPLLNLKQFQAFMDLVKSLSRRVEDEQTRKLQELSQTGNGTAPAATEDFMAFGGVSGTVFDASNGASENDFESLVKGRTSTSAAAGAGDVLSSWNAPAPATVGGPISRSSTSSRSQTPKAATFAWSSPNPTPAQNSPATSQFPVPGGVRSASQQQPTFRTVTPDLGGFQAMTPTTTQYSQPLQPKAQAAASQPPSMNWSTSSSSAAAPNPWASSSASGGMAALAAQRPAAAPSQGSFSLAPPPGSGPTSPSGFSIPSPGRAPSGTGMGMGMMNRQAGGTGMGMGTSMGMGMMGQQQQQGIGSMNSLAGLSLGQGSASGSSMNSMMGGMGMGMAAQQQQQQQAQKPAPGSGLDKYQSLI